MPDHLAGVAEALDVRVLGGVELHEEAGRETRGGVVPGVVGTGAGQRDGSDIGNSEDADQERGDREEELGKRRHCELGFLGSI